MALRMIRLRGAVHIVYIGKLLSSGRRVPECLRATLLVCSVYQEAPFRSWGKNGGLMASKLSDAIRMSPSQCPVPFPSTRHKVDLHKPDSDLRNLLHRKQDRRLFRPAWCQEHGPTRKTNPQNHEYGVNDFHWPAVFGTKK